MAKKEAPQLTIRFTCSAQVRGKSYRKGDKATFDEQTARAYINAGQAELVEGDEATAMKWAATKKAPSKPPTGSK